MRQSRRSASSSRRCADGCAPGVLLVCVEPGAWSGGGGVYDGMPAAARGNGVLQPAQPVAFSDPAAASRYAPLLSRRPPRWTEVPRPDELPIQRAARGRRLRVQEGGLALLLLALLLLLVGVPDVLLSSSVAVGPLAAACHSSSSCVAQRTPHLPLTRNHHAGRPRPHHHLQANAHATSPPLPR